MGGKGKKRRAHAQTLGQRNRVLRVGGERVSLSANPGERKKQEKIGGRRGRSKMKRFGKKEGGEGGRKRITAPP